MEIRFTKVSDARHRLTVVRDDGSTESRELDSRSFLRHDLAHFAVEAALDLRGGFWGSVAGGAGLDGIGLAGDDIVLAESLAGPMQTLMRTEASAEQIAEVVARVAPHLDAAAVGADVHEQLRRLRGHWRATPYGDDMVLRWPSSWRAVGA